VRLLLLPVVKTEERDLKDRTDGDLYLMFSKSCHHHRRNSEMRQSTELRRCFLTERKYVLRKDY
jgi:hypothetical protein